jgi:hypothetical protein
MQPGPEAVVINSQSGGFMAGNTAPDMTSFPAAPADATATVSTFPSSDPGLSQASMQQTVSKGASAESIGLNKKLASEEQLSKVLSGEDKGKAMAGAGTNKEIRDEPRLLNEHGGAKGEWSKKSSPTYKAADGSKVETHWYENENTGKRVEPKSKIMDE